MVMLTTSQIEGFAMGIKATKVNPDRYFTDRKLVDFVNHVQDGDLKKVNEAIRSGINVNAEGKQGFRPIFFVFPADNAEVAKALLSAGADPNIRLADRSTPLYFSVRLENTSFTRALLEAKANPKALVENDKPIIHEAVMAGNVDQVKLLAKAGADVNVVWGSTPLMSALDGTVYPVAAALLDLGADTSWRESGGATAFTAGESFCFSIPRMNAKDPKVNKDVVALFEAFAKRGVVLTCGKDVQRFR
jgi:Ankyrin repeats (3 copies)